MKDLTSRLTNAWRGSKKGVACLVLGAGLVFGSSSKAEPPENSRQQSFDFVNKIINQRRGDVYHDRTLILGFGHGKNDANMKKYEGITNAYGKQYDGIYSSNISGNAITNLLHSASGYLNVQVVGPGEDTKRIVTKELDVHSQGAITLMNWANSGMIKAETINLYSPPFASSPGYLRKLESAVRKTGAERVIIHQNADDNLTKTFLPVPHSELLKFKNYDGSDGIGLGVKIPFGHGGRPIDIELNTYHSNKGINKNESRNGIMYNEIYKAPRRGHFLENYFENKRYKRSLKNDYTLNSHLENQQGGIITQDNAGGVLIDKENVYLNDEEGVIEEIKEPILMASREKKEQIDNEFEHKGQKYRAVALPFGKD